MEAKELMLNNLVLFDNRICKIVATNAYRDCVEFIDISDEDNEVIGKYAKHINPIPLTPEILELNGFLFDDEIEVWYIEDGDHLAFEMQEYEPPYMFSDFAVIEYVHELQRALRLCELTDLADNFKVK